MDTLVGPAKAPDLREVVARMADYAEEQARGGLPVKAVARHMLGLFSGMKGAKAWRRHISEHAHLPGAGPEVLLDALACVEMPEPVDA
jgi:tRNA-dihydrouridine synthase A